MLFLKQLDYLIETDNIVKKGWLYQRFLVVGGVQARYRIELQTSSIQDEMWHLKWFVQITHHHLTPGIYIHYTLKSLYMENQWTIQIPTPNYASEVSLIKYMFLTRYVYYILFKNRCQFEIVVHHDIGMSLIAHLQLLLVKWDETNWSEKNALTSVVMGDFWLLL